MTPNLSASVDGVSRPHTEFQARYASALRAHLRQSSEEALHLAHALGRDAVADGLGVLDLTLLHHEALASAMAEALGSGPPRAYDLAAAFLAEVLSPFEMMLRGYQEANTRLTAVHEQLRAEAEERRRAEEQLLHAKKLQAVGLLAGGVAHHFNNLLTVVLGNLELARRRNAGDERTERLLVAARRGAERGVVVTRQLLSFSRQQMLQPRAIDIATWLQEVKPLLSSTLRGDILVDIHTGADLAPVVLDPGQLELAILNLALNARDAMPEGGTLSLAARNATVAEPRLGLDGSFVVIEVADTGEGVPAEALPDVFEPFFTTRNRGPGAGLGLSQVHGFVHQSGGAVEMENRPEGGALVRMYLPASTLPREAEVLAAPPEVPEDAVGGRVLVVEDDVDLARLAAELLESLGYTVRLAHRAQAALDILGEGERVDLVFSDVLVPGGMNGVQLARELAARFPQLPVLLTSGQNEAVQELDEQGVAFIPKPYKREDLREGIDRVLKLRR